MSETEPKKFSWLSIVGAVLLILLVGIYLADPFTMENKDAPDAALTLLDGDRINLSDHEGNEVVVLDFWATWCGPCRMTLPILDDVSQDYAGKNVAFYAVNVQESPELVQHFLNEVPLTLPIVMDTNGEVATRFRTFAFPTTIFIDKQGTVRKVSMGASPHYAVELRVEIDALLAEQPNLAE